MSSRIDYTKDRRRVRALRACREYPADTDKQLPRVRPVLGWRTEWPEEFPVIVTKIEPKTREAA